MDALSCDVLSTREVNRALRALPDGSVVTIEAPQGRHNLAVGLRGSVDVTIAGHVGYYVGGLCGDRDGSGPTITIEGFSGWGAGENLMGGTIRIRGSASQSTGSSAHGGLICVEGDSSLRTGISLKGGSVVVGGDVGAMTGFMAQAGTIVVGGAAGEGLGDSLYEAVIYVAGTIASLGADARIEELTDADVTLLTDLVRRSGMDHISPSDVKRVASSRRLYHFSSQRAGVY